MLLRFIIVGLFVGVLGVVGCEANEPGGGAGTQEPDNFSDDSADEKSADGALATDGTASAGDENATGSTDEDGGNQPTGTDGADTDGVGGLGGGSTSDSCVPLGDGTEEGETIREISLMNCAGEYVKLSDLLCGKELAVIYFAAGWCQPCRDKQPKLQKLFDDYGDDGLVIYDIITEDNGPGQPATKAFCEEWVKEYSLTIPVMIDPTKKYVNDFLPSDGAMPVWMLVSKDGVIEVKHNGAGGDLEDLVEDLLGL